MLRTLLESSRRGSPGTGRGTSFSIAVHAFVVVAAVHATAASHVAPPDASHVIHLTYRPPTPPVASANPAAQRAETHSTSTLPSFPVAPIVPTDLPPIDAGITTTPINFSAQRPGTGIDSAIAESNPSQVFFAQQVDRAAQNISGDAPEYPALMRSTHRTGHVIAQFVVDTSGRVDARSVHIIDATDPLFGASVAAVLPSLRFAPARVGERAVSELVQQVFRFTLR